MSLQRLHRRRRRVPAPEIVDEHVGAHRRASRDREAHEQRPLAAAPERNRAGVADQLERTEDANVDQGAPSERPYQSASRTPLPLPYRPLARSWAPPTTLLLLIHTNPKEEYRCSSM